MSTIKLTNDIIAAAIEGFEVQRKQIDAKIAELRQLIEGAPAEAGGEAEVKPKGRKGGRRKMSAAARARIAEAQKKRWAVYRGGAAKAPKAATKRRLSAAGRRRIIEATKRRWARVRAEAAKKAAS